MRLFLAIDLPSVVKGQISAELSGFKMKYPDFRWVPEKNYHITVHFFGEVADPKKIIKQVEEDVFDIAQFYLFSSEVEDFIDTKILLYLKFRREKILEKLAERIRVWSSLKTRSKFIPHISLARYRIPSKQQYFVIKKKASSITLNIEFPVKKLYLFNSIQQQGKPVYEKIASFDLYRQ